MKQNWGRQAALLGCLWAFSSPAVAGQTTNTVPAKLTVFAGCLLQTRPLMFVAPNALLNLSIDATATLTVKCTPNTPFSIDIDDGLHAQGNNKRRMKGPSGPDVSYNVYVDAARTRVWGKGNSKNVTGNSGSGAPVDVPVYGRVPVAAILSRGTYTDTLVVTLNF